jgi:hypothetical protein
MRGNLWTAYMSKNSLELNGRPRSSTRPSLNARLETVRYLNEINSSSGGRRKYTTNLQRIAEALVAAGYTSLDEQAKALGIHRATAWTIIKEKHKLGRLNHKTIKRILENSETPPAVRVIVQHLTEKCDD